MREKKEMFPSSFFAFGGIPGAAALVSFITLPWKYLWSWLFPPPEFPMPKFPILGHIPYVFATTLFTFRVEKAIGWMSKIAGYPAFRLQIGKLPGLFLNDVQSVKAALESDCCNDRPYTTFAHVFFNDGITTSSGRRWEKVKSLALRGLQEYGPGSPDFNKILDEDVKKMLDMVVREHGKWPSDVGAGAGASGGVGVGPATAGTSASGLKSGSSPSPPSKTVDFRHHFYSVPISATIWMVMRRRVDLTDKDFESFVRTTVETLGKGGNIGWVDVFPSYLTWWIPDFLSGMSEARRKRDVLHGYLIKLMQSELKSRQPGKPRHMLDLYVDELLSNTEKNFDEHVLRSEILPVIADLVCSPESVGTSIGWSLGYLAANQFDQKKIQDEIDALGLGKDDLPAYGEHHNRCPFTMAALHEATRLGTAAPFGFPHYARQDYDLKIFKVRKGDYVMPNLYYAHRDKKYFPNPEEFKPDRFIEKTEKGDKLKPMEGFLAFSTGQRRCPAESVSWHIIFKVMTALFKDYDVSSEKVSVGGPGPNLFLPFIRAPSTMRAVVRARPHHSQ